jgi:predicted DNA binding CopG/RHH family protein
MSGKIKYTNERMGKPKVIQDFLPSPEELAFRDEDVKITITLSKKSVDFFKSAAARGDTQYQRMIRRLLDAYADAHMGAAVRGSSRARSRAPRAG